MKKRVSIILFAALVVIASSAQQFMPITYSPSIKQIEIDGDKFSIQIFVSPNGKDKWSGRKATVSGNDGPFLTLERARDELRKIKRSKQTFQGGIAINLMGGIYSLAKTFELNSEDGGTEGSPVVFRAYKDEAVQLIGGKKIVSKDITVINDPTILARINPMAKGKLMQFNTKQLGINHANMFPDMFSDGGGIFELFFNGKRLPLSRKPPTNTIL